MADDGHLPIEGRAAWCQKVAAALKIVFSLHTRLDMKGTAFCLFDLRVDSCT